MTKLCAKWCGRGCTKEERDRALRIARRLASQLGLGWHSDVWENLGWHARAVSACGRLKVHPNIYKGHSVTYTAFLGCPDFPGGRWTGRSKDPKAAVRQAVKAARRDLARIGAILEGLA